ncbi:MAG: hypothetical protein JXR37_11345 [Kiritimatiellae bacterium]|nr:hypothetical protein [Kiritimatiellia bacterium]
MYRATSRFCWGLVLLGVAAGARIVRAEEMTIEGAVRLLGHAEFGRREAASRFLWARGVAAKRALEEAAGSDDPEIAWRAKALLDKIGRGIGPDTPPAIARLTETYGASDLDGKREALSALCEEGAPGLGCALRLLANESYPARQALLRREGTRLCRAALAALVQGDAERAGALLRLCAWSGEPEHLQVFVLHALVRGGLKEEIERLEPLAGKAPDAARALAYLYRADARFGAALAAAERAQDDGLQLGLLHEAGEWRRLLERLTEQGPWDERIDWLALRATYERLAGEHDACRATLAEIEGMVPAHKDKVRAAADALAANDAWGRAVRLLVAEESVVDALGYLHLLEQFDEMLRLAARLTPQQRAEKPLAVAIALAADLLGTNVAATGVAAATDRPLDDTPEARSAYAFRALNNNPEPGKALLTLYGERRPEAAVWWEYLRKREPDAGVAQLFPVLERILGPKPERAEVESRAREAAAACGDLPPEKRVAWLDAVARTCERAGLHELALEILRESVVADQPISARVWLRCGDIHLDQKHWVEAADCYEKAGKAKGDWPLPTYLWGWCLKQAGQAERGDRLIELATLMPLGDDSARCRLAFELAERAVPGAEQRTQWVLGTAPFGSLSYRIVATELAVRSAEQRDYARAARCGELSRFRLAGRQAAQVRLDSPNRGHLLVPVFAALAHLEAGRLDEALPLAERAVAALPGSIVPAIMVCPALQRHGRPKAAERLFETTYAALHRVCREYPDSAHSRNALAWLCARCRLRLQDGLVHARRAVALQPDRCGYLDTLAEVQFQLGHDKEAIELMRRCIELNPGLEYYQGQLERFTKGDRASDPKEPIGY